MTRPAPNPAGSGPAQRSGARMQARDLLGTSGFVRGRERGDEVTVFGYSASGLLVVVSPPQTAGAHGTVSWVRASDFVPTLPAPEA